MYKLIWSYRALNDLDDAFEMLAKKSFEVAKDTIELILGKADQLLEFPKSGPKELRLAHRKEAYRYLIKGHYKIIYRIEASKIIIVRVFDTRKDPEEM